MISVTFFLWFDPHNNRNSKWVYGVEHVNLLVNQVDRHLSLPHEFVLVCDQAPEGLDPRVRTVPIDPTTYRPTTCFARLMLFRPDIGDIIGKRILAMDLDSVVVGSLDDIAGRTEDVVLWHHPRYGTNPRVPRYNTSIMLIKAGTRPQVWTEFPSFDLTTLPKGDKSEDQGWLSHIIPNEAGFTAKDGVYSARLLEMGFHGPYNGQLPANARFITFPGSSREPSLPETQANHPWIRNHRW